jgi:hypothetical protein
MCLLCGAPDCMLVNTLRTQVRHTIKTNCWLFIHFTNLIDVGSKFVVIQRSALN